MKNNNQICPKCGAKLIIDFDYAENPIIEFCSNSKCSYRVRLAPIQECDEDHHQMMNGARISQSLPEDYFKQILNSIKELEKE